MNVAAQTARAAQQLIDQANTAAKTLMTPVFNVMGYGASGLGVKADTVAIQAAIDAVPMGGTVYLPEGNYLVSDTIVIDKPIHFVGGGYSTQIMVSASMSSSTDVIRIAPQQPGFGEFWSLRDFLILPASGAPARHGIHIDGSLPGHPVNNLWMQGVYIRPLGGKALVLTNPLRHDAFFTSTLIQNVFYGGIDLSGSGDSLRIMNNTITGKNGLVIDAVDGALQTLIMGNNITCEAGTRILNGGQVKIRDNQIEQVAPTTNVDDALISLVGRAGYPIAMAEITGNNISVTAELGGTVGRNILVTYANNTVIENNRISRYTGMAHIDIQAGAKNTIVGHNVYQAYGAPFDMEAPVIVNAGKGTIGVWKDATLLNSWVNFSAGSYATAGFMKDHFGMVHLKGTIANGTTTPGTVLFVLPEGLRPTLIHRFNVLCDEFGTQVAGEVTVWPTGEVKLLRGANNYLALDRMTFPAPGLTNATA